MSIFSASGSIMAVFGLFSMIKFTTIDKYLNKNQIAQSSTGVTGGPINPEEAEIIKENNIKKAEIKIQRELKSEFKGIILTVIGTLIASYGAYIPILYQHFN